MLKVIKPMYRFRRVPLILSLLFLGYSAAMDFYSVDQDIGKLGTRISKIAVYGSHRGYVGQIIDKLSGMFRGLVPHKTLPSSSQSSKAVSKGLEVKMIMFTGGVLNGSVVTRNFQRFCDTAKKNLDIAFFDIGNFDFARSIVTAKKRGVNVAVVTDDRSLNRKAIAFLKANGIHVESDRGRAFMHNKFAVADGRFVWTGSLDATSKGINSNINDAVIIKSPTLAASFENEFGEMFHRGIYGEGKPGSGYVEYGKGRAAWAFFGPEDSIKDNLIKLIRKAKKRVRFMVFSFTHPDIADALIEAKKRGVEVMGVVDAGQAVSNKRFDQSQRLTKAGIDVKRVGGRNYKMRHKVIVVDGKYVGFGSFNWTRSSDSRNDENLVVLRDMKVARVFGQEFMRVYR